MKTVDDFEKSTKGDDTYSNPDKRKKPSCVGAHERLFYSGFRVL